MDSKPLNRRALLKSGTGGVHRSVATIEAARRGQVPVPNR
jgi:hypothetical protein